MQYMWQGSDEAELDAYWEAAEKFVQQYPSFDIRAISRIHLSRHCDTCARKSAELDASLRVTSQSGIARLMADWNRGFSWPS